MKDPAPETTAAPALPSAPRPAPSLVYSELPDGRGGTNVEAIVYTDEMGALFRGMSQSGWWQASGATFMTATEADGVSRFVTIIPRTEADALEFLPAEPTASPRDSTTQAGGSAGAAV